MTRDRSERSAGRRARRIATAVAAAAAATFLAAGGCGGGGGGSSHHRTRRPVVAAKAKAMARRGGSAKPLATYPKVPDSVRRSFSPRDFQPDPSGERNRDPFQSFVVNQPGESNGGGPAVIDPTDVCKPDRSIATNYSLRDLRLIGIVLRGTDSYGLFRDTAKVGHIVHRGDCLGKEKALVEKIGAGFVRLEVVPEAPQGAAAPAPEEREILLHPQEYQLPTRDEKGSR